MCQWSSVLYFSPESVESNESAEMEEGVESDEYIEEEVGWQ